MIERSAVYLASTTKPTRGESAERADQSESALTWPNRDPLLFFNGELSGLQQPQVDAGATAEGCSSPMEGSVSHGPAQPLSQRAPRGARGSV